MLVLDTSALSGVMHDIPESMARLRRLRPEDVVVVAPVAAEIHYGLERLEAGSRRRRLLALAYKAVRSAAQFQDWNEPAALEFGRLKADLERRGKTVADFDVAIAAIALSLGARVATMNVRHFERIEGLEIENWSAASSG